MILRATDTASQIQQSYADLIVVPILFSEPDEGYSVWLQQTSNGNQTTITPNSIPDKILKATGEAIYWGRLLPHIISGRYERLLLQSTPAEWHHLRDRIMAVDSDHIGDLYDLTEVCLSMTTGDDAVFPLAYATQAKLCRLRFEEGEPLYIGMWANNNRYMSFDPILAYRGENRYLLGGRKNTLKITAESHEQAIQRAWIWYKEQHGREVGQLKQWGKQFSPPPLMLHILTAMLDKIGVVYDSHNTKIAWKNGGVHGHFGVVSTDWGYLLQCSPSVAAKLALLSQQSAMKQKAATALKIPSGQIAALLGLTETAKANAPLKLNQFQLHHRRDDLYEVREGDKVLWGIHVSPKSVKIKSKETPTITYESAIPVSWQLTRLDCLAWGMWFALNKAQPPTKKKSAA